MHLTDYHAKYFAHELTKRCASDSLEKLAGTLVDAQVDLNPHQVEAALFAFKSPLSKGAIFADEVGLGKTIEAGLVISQKWAERKRRILVITPAHLRKQWHQELQEKFFLPCRILESKSYNASIKRGNLRPLQAEDIIICSYQFARGKAADVSSMSWDLVVIDEAHRLRNVYKPSNVIADDHADLLYDLAGQMVKHLLSYLSEEDARNVLIYHQKQLVSFIHVQMQTHYWEKATGYDVVVRKGFTALKPSAFTAATTESMHDFRQTVQDRSRIAQMLFGGFQRCLYSIQKFQSDSERKLAIILDREAVKWFKPAIGKFQMYYKSGVDLLEYQPDFVAETTDCLYMLEAKARNDMQDAEVQAKKDAAVQWCRHATSHALSYGGNAWLYLLIPHDAITENMTLLGLANQFRIA